MKYIIDTDIGGDIDDTLALLVALASNNIPMAIMTTHTEAKAEKARIAKILVSEYGCPNIPVYAGIGCTRTDPQEKFNSQNPLFDPSFGYPNPKLTGKKWYPQQAAAYKASYPNIYNETKIEADTAADAIVKLAKSAEFSPNNKLTIVSLGPLHNLDAALTKDPTIAANIKIVSMGGGYNWLIAPDVSARVVSKVETVVIDSEFINKNGFYITPEQLDDLEKKDHPVIGDAVLKDWKNWRERGNANRRKNSNLYDPVTLYLALNPDKIKTLEHKHVSFPCLDEKGQVKSEFHGISYAKEGIKNKIINLVDDVKSHVSFVKEVHNAPQILETIYASIRDKLIKKPTLKVATL